MTSYSRQDVQRILQISSRQLQGWERAGLIPPQQVYTFQDLGQLRILRALRENDVPAAYIRHSIMAMKAVAGMANPLLEACTVRSGTRLAFRHHGAVVDPIRRQLLFDFERLNRPGVDLPDRVDRRSASSELRSAVAAEPRGIQIARCGASRRNWRKASRHRPLSRILELDPDYAPASINWARCTFICGSSPAPRNSTAAPRWPTLTTCSPISISATYLTSWNARMKPSPPIVRPLPSSPLRRRSLQPRHGLRA